MKLNNNDDSHNSGLNLLIYNMLLDIESHPAWVCGLKRLRYELCRTRCGHTLRGCVDWNIRLYNSFAGSPSHTLRGCVDWNFNLVQKWSAIIGHTLRGCVDWNYTTIVYEPFTQSHPAWVCGLKLYPLLSFRPKHRHTLRGCVDWNTMFSNDGPIKEPSHPAWVCGLKPQKKQRCNSTRCHTLRGCVDWNNRNTSFLKLRLVTPCVGVWIETSQ